MRKRLIALLTTAVLMVTLVGGVLPASALWVKTPVLMGDVDGNEKVNTTDARLVLQYAADRIDDLALNVERADVDNNEKQNTTDARLILQYAAGRIPEFPCGTVYTATLSEAETTPNTNTEEFATYTSGNPIITSQFTADPSAHVWKDGKLYLYPSTDNFPPQGCDKMDNYHVFTTDNMVDYVDEGEIMDSHDVMWSNCDGFMWAPDCCYIEETDTYYYFFPHPITNDRLVVGKNDDGSDKTDNGWNYSWVMGVAKSVGSPTGPFEQIGYVKLEDGLVTDEELAATSPFALQGNNKKSQLTGWFDSSVLADLTAWDGKKLGDHGVSGAALGGYSLIDPCAFVDEDGTVYLYYGGGSGCFVVELADDMVTATTKPRRLGGLTDFHEGGWVFKNPETGYYYMMYADNNSGRNRLRYAMSYTPTGPFSYAGMLLNITNCDTSHGSVVQYKGNWYLFYHDATLSGGVTNLRSTRVDYLFFKEDGKIEVVEQTLTGVSAVGAPSRSNTAGVNIPQSAFTVATTYGMDSCAVGGGATKGEVVEYMNNGGSYCEFSGIDGGKGGKALLTVTYSTEKERSALTYVGSTADKTGKGYYLRLNPTTGWDDYSGTASCIVDLAAGTDNVIRLNNGQNGFNVKEITVSLLPDNANT